MPAYEEALAAQPAAFVDCAAAMSAAGNDLTEHRGEYDTTVTTINDGWHDTANTAFNDDVDLVDEHVDQVVAKVGDAAEVLSTGGSAMVSQVEQLKAVDAAYKGAGFVVQPAPKVELGPAHWAAIAAAGPFGPVLQAVFQARADEGTMRLTTGLAVLTATDVATGTSLTAAAEALQPLEDKGPGATDCLPVEDDGTDGNLEKEERQTDVKAQKDTEKDTEKDSGKDDSGEDEDEKSDDKDKEDQDKDQGKDDQDKDPEQPGDQQPQPEVPQPDRERPENEVPGFEPPDPVGPEVPDFTTDPIVPGGPDLGDPWKPTELEDAEVPSGGLASGGGGGGIGGGGPGSSGVPSGTSGTGSGGPLGFVGTPAGGTPAGAPAGGRPGLGGGLVGAPGARGPVNGDEEYERESFLTEDPEDDVWGIGTDEGNPYVDYQEEQAQQSDLPTLAPVEELPPFALPGFDLPEPGKS
ncbi:hypothetical protein [Glycomyces sp. NPDC021274]|uniref:WXG100 family type VII secretion target n=1 Tax=Glycomyces sp. NPDC021274 TaxID=3155120 RepID=UPI003405BEA5